MCNVEFCDEAALLALLCFAILYHRKLLAAMHHTDRVSVLAIVVACSD